MCWYRGETYARLSWQVVKRSLQKHFPEIVELARSFWNDRLQKTSQMLVVRSIHSSQLAEGPFGIESSEKQPMMIQCLSCKQLYSQPECKMFANLCLIM